MTPWGVAIMMSEEFTPWARISSPGEDNNNKLKSTYVFELKVLIFEFGTINKCS
jgi:hypothetical protein